MSRFELAHAFPVGSEITYHDLATKAGVGETHIRKLVRHAITQQIFTEIRPGTIAHSACSRLIAEDDTVSSYLKFITDDAWHAAYHVCDAVAKWTGSEEPDETVSVFRRLKEEKGGAGGWRPQLLAIHTDTDFKGFAIAKDTNKSLFDYLSDHPEKAKYFYKTMRAYAQRSGTEPKYVADQPLWGSLPAGSTGRFTRSTPMSLTRKSSFGVLIRKGSYWS